MDGPGIESRWGARFSAPVQTGPAAHPAGSYPGVKRTGRGFEHPPQSTAEVKERVELYLYSLWAFVACSRLTFTFKFTLRIYIYNFYIQIGFIFFFENLYVANNFPYILYIMFFN
jgi:hypothetical protein